MQKPCGSTETTLAWIELSDLLFPLKIPEKSLKSQFLWRANTSSGPLRLFVGFVTMAQFLGKLRGAWSDVLS